MSSTYERAVDVFLRRIGQGIFRGNVLNRIWKAFMAYCMCIVTEAFRRRGYRVRATQPLPQGFIFKCFPRGDPNNYSYFTVEKGDEKYEIRLNIFVRNFRWNSLRLNLDVVVIRANSPFRNDTIDARDLVTFAECKNLRGFPELVASIVGMVYELQRERLYRGSISNFTIPCCLLLSGNGRSILHMNNFYQSKNISMRIFDQLQPGSPNVQNFIQYWF